VFARLELTIIGAWHTFHEFGTSFSYTCYVSRPLEIAGQARTEWVKTREDVHIHIDGPTATLQPELGPGDYEISCIFKQGGHATSKKLAVKVVRTGHKDSRLILSADGPQVKWSGSPSRPVRCELLQTNRHFNTSHIPSWKRLYGTQNFRVSECSSRTNCDFTVLYLGETNDYDAMTTYACQFGLQTRCLSKLFIQVNMNSTKVVFTPNLHFYRRLNTLSCQVVQADGYTTPTYMMLEKYPNSFRPAIWYEVIQFRNHFPGGEYVVACHYISEHATRESIRKRILLYDTPRRLYIHQTPVEPEGYRFACVSDGYPPVPTRIAWTILTGSKYGFEHVDDGLSLTKFAPYGVYQIQCNATFVYPDTQLNLHSTFNFSYTCEFMGMDDYLELDTCEIDPAELHHFLEMLRDFDIVQQIMSQVIQAKRQQHLRMSDRSGASEITDLTHSASSGKRASGRTTSMSSVDRPSLEQEYCV
ncbi:hypothetical protein EG68_07930, partial [Paragonimus skrjabini miyazakii]